MLYLERNPSQLVFMRVLYSGRSGICRCWFFWRVENRSTQRKKPLNKTRTDNKLNLHDTRIGIKSSFLSAEPSQPPPPPPTVRTSSFQTKVECFVPSSYHIQSVKFFLVLF